MKPVGRIASGQALAQAIPGFVLARAQFLENGVSTVWVSTLTTDNFWPLTQMYWSASVELQVLMHALMAWQAWIESVASVTVSSGSGCHASALIAFRRHPLKCRQLDAPIMLWTQSLL